jgi:hypothetical protein
LIKETLSMQSECGRIATSIWTSPTTLHIFQLSVTGH